MRTRCKHLLSQQKPTSGLFLSSKQQDGLLSPSVLYHSPWQFYWSRIFTDHAPVPEVQDPSGFTLSNTVALGDNPLAVGSCHKVHRSKAAGISWEVLQSLCPELSALWIPREALPSITYLWPWYSPLGGVGAWSSDDKSFAFAVASCNPLSKKIVILGENREQSAFSNLPL